MTKHIQNKRVILTLIRNFKKNTISNLDLHVVQNGIFAQKITNFQ